MGAWRNSGSAKVASHQFRGPRRLAHFAARCETLEIRFYIQNRRAVYRVELVNTNVQTGTDSILQMVMPMRLGRSFERCAKIPILGQSARPRG